MRRLPIILLVVLCPLIWACDEDGGDDPTTTEDTQPSQDTAQEDDTGSSGELCGCEAMVGKAFRFVDMVVTQPDDGIPGVGGDDQLRNLLNGYWERDIDLGILNVVFEIVSVDTTTGEIILKAGSGWKKKDGADCDFYDEGCDYYMMHDYSSDIAFSLDGCEFSTKEEFTLFFHTGPASDPILCGPELTPAHAIPLKNLTAQGEFTNGCTKIENASLSGCVPLDAADLICFCSQADDYTKCDNTLEPDSTIYCKNTCGSTYMNFGGSVTNLFMLTPDCDTDGDGIDDGISLGGAFNAELLDVYLEE